MIFLEPWKVVLAVAALNVILSGLHFVLLRIKDKTKCQLDNRLDDVVTFMLTLLEWVMATGRRGPPP